MRKEIEEFLKEKELMGMSVNTILAYKQNLNKFFTVVNKELQDVSKKDIQNYINQALTMGFDPNTVRQNIVIVKTLYKQLDMLGTRFNGLSLPKGKQLLPKMLNRNEVEKIIGVCKNKKYAFLIELLVKTGLRISEALSLTRDNFINDNKLIKVKGKGGKERLIPVPITLLGSVNKHLNSICTQHLFPSRLGDFPMKRMFVAQKLKTLSKKAGLDNKKVSAHIFRHTYASQLIEVGGDIREVQELLGHSSIITTQRYTHCSGEQLNKLVNKL